ncbi:hypothetical protein C8Q69DRAFT_440212 [Paecilomyces variotii]|uniref:Rhodopsin domain-containing protein n=1 Tax=Byssochlamys spectabilis TaxID=264951 RepID=A0A443I4W8_BYSSP|nr:hypothetical protein C8Q69DRAFT_440212 [Paecilomyces variotii]KAJ9206938.1 hypothetical protein DTO032I3_1526 [Paecilomyces variotii]KAJ9226406.1 hypothetical protein DTO169C6_1134 [Paecilomyces variotii]KAJ9237810.1 hypothetical protein DTO169E5_4981 [Paecilomyces variotii]KAJ9281451.1 hypothetical protein DTO021D3_1674 [Paecilomyces variotii]KAJ9346710.1 hypothetical protein DTO027B6_964 [Paecilomyces variotii]
MVNYGQSTPGVPDRGYVLYITALVMVLVASLFVGARIGSRIYTGRLGVDDATIIAALACSVLVTATINMAVVSGYGRHLSNLTVSQKRKAFEWFFIAQIFYKLVLGFTKFSIVWLYLRIFITKGFQIIGKIFLVLITLWAIGTMLATILQCIPIQASWDKSVKNPKCINKDAFWYAFAATNTVTDFAIFLLPIYPAMKLQLNKREKIGLLAVFAMGAFACTASIIRTVAVSQTSARELDLSWDFIPRSTWTLVEANVGIICACLPTLRYPLSRLFPFLFRGSVRGGMSTRRTGSSHYVLHTISRRRAHLSGSSYTVPGFTAFEQQSQEQIVRNPDLEERDYPGRESSGSGSATSAPSGITKTTQVQIAYMDGRPVKVNSDAVEVV